MIYREEESFTIANSYKSEPLEGRDPWATSEQILNMKFLDGGTVLAPPGHVVYEQPQRFMDCAHLRELLVSWVLLGLDHYVQVVKL